MLYIKLCQKAKSADNVNSGITGDGKRLLYHNGKTLSFRIVPEDLSSIGVGHA